MDVTQRDDVDRLDELKRDSREECRLRKPTTPVLDNRGNGPARAGSPYGFVETSATPLEGSALFSTSVVRGLRAETISNLSVNGSSVNRIPDSKD